MQSQFGSLGQHFLSTWSIAMNLLGFPSSFPSSFSREICPYGSLRSHGHSLRSLPVPLYIPSSPYPLLSLYLYPYTPPYRAVRAGPGRPGRIRAWRAGVQGRQTAGPPVGGLVNPVRDSLGGIGGGEKHQFLIGFLANLGPLWAHDPPNRGHGWLSLVFLCMFGTTNVHFGAKNAIFRPFSWNF